jgi:ornithine cyclodeaminase/alanine dehydrogenase
MITAQAVPAATTAERKRRLLYLSRSDVESVGLPMSEVIDLLERAFVEKGEGRVEMPPKPGIHTRPDAFIHAMPAWIPGLGAAGIKWVSGYPANQEYGLPYISGLLVLNDPETGIPTTIMDCTWITAVRTGAATGLAARHFARPDSATAAILACGVQGRTNLEALACEFDLQRVHAYDVVPEVQARFVRDMTARLDIEVVGAASAYKAIRDADLVVTSGPILHHPHPTIEAGWLRPGAFASAVDFDSYWTTGAQAEFDRIVTDDLEQFAYYREQGYFRGTPPPSADLGAIVTGRRPGRLRDDERILTINLGLALEDMAVAPAVVRRAIDIGIGTLLPL